MLPRSSPAGHRGGPADRSGAAVADGQYIVKFAWSDPAALSVAREIGVVTASSTSPVLLVTRRVPGSSLFKVIDAIDRGQAGQQLARFLAALHQPAARAAAEAAVGDLHGFRALGIDPETPPAACLRARGESDRLVPCA
jgi:hypothetical protein